MTDCSNVAKRDRQRDFALEARAGARLTLLAEVDEAVDAFAGFEPFVGLVALDAVGLDAVALEARGDFAVVPPAGSVWAAASKPA